MVAPIREPQATTTDTGDIVHEVRAVYKAGRTRDIAWRLRQLRGIERLLSEREGEIAAALADDLGRTAAEAWLGDIASSKGEAVYARKHLKKWMRRRYTSLPANQLPGRGWVQYEPLGVVLIIGPWNYPVYLSLAPLVAAMAAGNCAVIKPSEVAPATSALLARVLPEYVDAEAVRVVEGNAATTQELLASGFDHAVFTGGTEIGKKIMAGAAATLTPVTLELGGKSPVYVSADADIDIAARRVAWVKLMNSGQTCIAPDYVLVHRDVAQQFADKVVAAVADFRSDTPETGLRIVNPRQFDRLVAYIATTKGALVTGGASDATALTIAPTVIMDPSPDDAVMAEEIFGPILPILTVESHQAAVEFIKSRPKPLAMYVFTSSRPLARRMIDDVPCGGVVINHVAMHCLTPQLPFGGVGASGMGDYHGRWGFERLSHRKAVLSKTAKPDLRVVYPPYTKSALKIMRRVF